MPVNHSIGYFQLAGFGYCCLLIAGTDRTQTKIIRAQTQIIRAQTGIIRAQTGIIILHYPFKRVVFRTKFGEPLSWKIVKLFKVKQSNLK